MKRHEWVQLCVLIKAVCENIFTMIEKQGLWLNFKMIVIIFSNPSNPSIQFFSFSFFSGRTIKFFENIFQFLLSHKVSFVCMETKNFDIFRPGHSKWCKTSTSDLEKMSAWMCVCVKTSENLKFCISGITQTIELKFAPQAHAALPLVLFSFKLIHGLGFYDNFNFLKNICNRSSCRKF